jgi:hypothetical protein
VPSVFTFKLEMNSKCSTLPDPGSRLLYKRVSVACHQADQKLVANYSRGTRRARCLAMRSELLHTQRPSATGSWGFLFSETISKLLSGIALFWLRCTRSKFIGLRRIGASVVLRNLPFWFLHTALRLTFAFGASKRPCEDATSPSVPLCQTSATSLTR